MTKRRPNPTIPTFEELRSRAPADFPGDLLSSLLTSVEKQIEAYPNNNYWRATASHFPKTGETSTITLLVSPDIGNGWSVQADVGPIEMLGQKAKCPHCGREI